MKKFLFTLAALLMAGSAFADEYLFMDDFEVPQSVMQETSAKKRSMTVPIHAQFDRYVSAFQMFIECPEGVTVYNVSTGTDYPLSYYDAMDNLIENFVPGFQWDATNSKGIAAVLLEVGYYYPEGTDPDEDDPVCYGNVKWQGNYDNFLMVTLRFDADFTGGELMLITEPSSTPDTRGEICPKGQHFEIPCNITVESGEPVVTDAPEIVVTAGDDAYIFDVVGPEGAELKLFVDGVEVEIPYTVARTDADQIVKLTATSHIEGQIDGTVTGEYLVPALPVVEPEDLTGEIVIGDPDENGNVTINYTGDENVTIVVTVNGEVVEVVDGVITVGEGESEIIVTVTAEGYNDLTDGKTVTYTVPVEPEQTEAPVITTEDNGEAVVVTATGNGHICIYWDDQLMAEGEGTATWTIPYGEDPEGEEYGVAATAQEEGKLVSDYARETVFVPGKAVEPQPTATPEISYVVTDTEVIITVTGEGEIHVYVDGVEVENPAIIVRGEEDETVVVTATAQAEGQLISETATEEIVIPAYVDDPEGHMTGYWVVLLDKNGAEVWVKLENTNTQDPNQYLANVALHYSQFGGQPIGEGMTDDDNPMVPFYFMIDGDRYACQGENVVPVYGNANENPLYETENFWNVNVGYYYTVGVLVDPATGNKYLQISKGIYTGIDEMNADKTVAAVRYFNMAGQEMQEANGMTIVVTTYTDGTTSAVKVMK